MLVFNKDSCYVFYYWLWCSDSTHTRKTHTTRHGGEWIKAGYLYEFTVKLQEVTVALEPIPTESLEASVKHVCFLPAPVTSVRLIYTFKKELFLFFLL